jgi:O-antigen/teichoic acid export membrane protein
MKSLRSLVGGYLTEAGRTAFGNLLGLVISTAFQQGSTIGVLVVVTRALAPAEFGLLAFALTLHAYLVLVGSLSSGAVVIRESVQRPQAISEIATAFFVLTAASSTLVCASVLAVVAASPVPGSERWLLALVALGIVPASMNMQPLYDAHHRQAWWAAIGAVAEGLGLVAVLWLWRGDALALPALGGVYAAKWGLSMAGQFLLFRATVLPIRWAPWCVEAGRILRASWPILLASVLFLIPLSSGVLLVRLRGGPAEAALFGLASQVANAYLIFASLGLQVLHPHVVGRYGLHRGFVGKLAVFTTVFVGGLAVLTFAGGWGMVRLLLPTTYEAAVAPMAWLLVAGVMLALARIGHAYLVRLQDEAFILVAHAVSAVLYAGGVLLVPASSVAMAAAALAPCAALAATAACFLRVRWRLRGTLVE